MELGRFFEAGGLVFAGTVVASSVALLACGTDVETLAGATGSGASTAAATTGSSGGAGGASSSSTSDSAQSSGSMAQASTGSGSDLCDPSPMDSACATCIKAQCCDELLACEADAACICFRQCKNTPDGKGMEGTQLCIMKCGDPGDTLGALRDCRSKECGMDCMGGGMSGGNMTTGGGN